MKKIIYQIIRYGFLAGFIILSIALLVSSMMPGKASSNQSDAIGDVVSDALDKITPEKTTIVEPTKVTITNTNKNVSVNDKVTLNAEVLPSNATNKSLIWTIDNTDMATIKGNIVTFKKEGQVTITVNIKNTTITNQITMNSKIVELTDVKITNAPSELFVNASITLGNRVVPSNASDKTVTWTSSDPAIATITNKGVVKCLKEGQVTFTVTATNGISTKVTLNAVTRVSDPIDAIQLFYQNELINEVSSTTLFTPKPLILYEGDNLTLSAITSPLEPKNNYLKWSSNDSKIVTVTSKGVVKALNEGSTYLQITSIYEGITMIQEVIVKSRPAEFAIKDNNSEIVITAGKGMMLDVEYQAMPNSYDITYRSSNEDIVTIEDDGYMIAKKSGTAIITVICESSDGTITEKTTTINVSRQPFSSRFDQFRRWIRKGIGHFGAFAILAVMAGATILFFFKKKYIWMIFSVSYGFVIAALTEIIQRFVPGRSGLFADVMLDFGGYMAGTACLFGIYYLVILIIYLVNKHKRKEVSDELSK